MTVDDAQPQDAFHARIARSGKGTKPTTTGQIDQLGDENLGRNSLHNVRLQGVEKECTSVIARPQSGKLGDQKLVGRFQRRTNPPARRLHTCMGGFREFLAEAAQRDVRKGVAFQQKAMDDTEHAVFAQRLAQKLHTKHAGSDYGKFLHHSVLSQGEVLGDMQWENWEVTKAAMELGGVNPNVLTDPRTTTPARRLAMVAKIDWHQVTLPRLKAKLGSSFKVDDAWKRRFGIERLKNIKAAVERGQPITDPHERRLLGIWRTLEVQLGRNVLPAGPKDDVGMTRLPMSLKDRTRFYKTLTGTDESVSTTLGLSPQSAYDYLTEYGMEVVTDEDAADLYLARVLQDLRDKTAFIPSSARGSEADRKRWRDSAARSWGGFLPAARCYDPGSSPGFAQWLAGMTTRGFKMRTNPSGRRVPYGYPEPEEVGRSDEMPGIKYSIDVASQEIPDEEINAFYRSRKSEATAAVEQELEKPARDAVSWLRRQGWVNDPTRVDDFVQDVVIGMMNRTGAVPDWRKNIGFRRATAMMLARRFASQGWPSATREKAGQAVVGMATGSNRNRGEDEFSRIRAGTGKAREVIQRAIASLLDADTSEMGDDEAAFVDALDSLNDPARTMDALNALDRLSTRYERSLPQVRRAVSRIQRHLEPLLGKVRAA